MSPSPISGIFPITDRPTAIMARRMAKASIRAAKQHDLPLPEIESAMDEFRLHWRRRRKKLNLTDLPEDPFE